MTVYSGASYYTCELCLKTFLHSGELKKHEQQHNEPSTKTDERKRKRSEEPNVDQSNKPVIIKIKKENLSDFFLL